MTEHIYQTDFNENVDQDIELLHQSKWDATSESKRQISATKLITLKIPIEMLHSLDATARNNGGTRSSTIRELLRRFLIRC